MQFAISKFSTRAIPLSGTGTIGTKYGMRFSKQICGNALKKSKDWFLDKKNESIIILIRGRDTSRKNKFIYGNDFFQMPQMNLWKRAFQYVLSEFVEMISMVPDITKKCPSDQNGKTEIDSQ